VQRIQFKKSNIWSRWEFLIYHHNYLHLHYYKDSPITNIKRTSKYELYKVICYFTFYTERTLTEVENFWKIMSY